MGSMVTRSEKTWVLEMIGAPIALKTGKRGIYPHVFRENLVQLLTFATGNKTETLFGCRGRLINMDCYFCDFLSLTDAILLNLLKQV